LQGLVDNSESCSPVRVMRVVPLMVFGSGGASFVHTFDLLFSAVVRFGMMWDRKNTAGNGCCPWFVRMIFMICVTA
jgi:hypothetical protein